MCNRKRGKKYPCVVNSVGLNNNNNGIPDDDAGRLAYSISMRLSTKEGSRMCEEENSSWRTSARWKAGAGALSNDKIRYLSVDPFLMNSGPCLFYTYLIFCFVLFFKLLSLSRVVSSMHSLHRRKFLLGLCLLASWRACVCVCMLCVCLSRMLVWTVGDPSVERWPA